MSVGLYTHTTRSNGTTLTASIYNADHQNHIANQNPEMTGSYSDNLAELQTLFDTANGANLPASLADELASLRFQIKALTGGAQWYTPVGVPIGPGNVVGAALSVEAEYVQFDGTTGRVLQQSGKFDATDANVRAATASGLLNAGLLESAAAGVALTDAATVAVDWDTAINWTLTVTANRAIGNPTNGQPGTFRHILVQGNDATDRTITFGNQFLGTLPTITDCDNNKWYHLTIKCVTTTHFIVASAVAKT